MSEETKKKHDTLQRLSAVEIGPEDKRVPTGVTGLDECLADGSEDSLPGVPLGTSILLSGMPGGGKSTIATTMGLAAIGESLYLHGEEKARSVKKRAERIKGKEPRDMFLSPLKEAEKALDDIRNLSGDQDRELERVVVDSIQTLSLGGSRKYDAQFEALEMIVGQVCSNNGIVIAVSHVSKTGNDHAGAAALAHLVDIHLHMKTNAKTAERFLEVRKNRHGRAGFQVPVNIGAKSISVGVPAPLSPQEGLMGARNALERTRDKAVELLMEGKKLNFYDFDLGPAGTTGGMWRAGLEMAVKSMARDGHEMMDEKVKGRRTFWMKNPPPAPDAPIAIVPALPKAVTDGEAPMPIELD